MSILPLTIQAQDWRLSGGYSLHSSSLQYVPNKNYNAKLSPLVKSVVEIELEKYFFYRFYTAVKTDFIIQDQEDVLIGGPINFNQTNIGAILGAQWPKWGVYGGVKAGLINNVNIISRNRNGDVIWVDPEKPVSTLTTSFTGGVKYYLLNFVRLNFEVNYMNNPPANIIPEQSFSQPAAFQSFNFNNLSFTAGVTISIPWNSPKRIERINRKENLPPLISTGSINFESPLTTPAIITSRYGPRWNSTHKGVDIDASLNDNILAAESGIVVKAGKGTGYGKMVRIRHSNGYETVYAHLMTIKVKEGKHVRRGSVIGKAGNTGTSTGVHLHFEIIKDGEHIDPLSYIRF